MDKTIANVINFLCNSLFPFLMATTPAIKLKNVKPLVVAYVAGRKEKSYPSILLVKNNAAMIEGSSMDTAMIIQL